MPDFDRIRVLLHSDGRLHWEPGGIFKTTCDIDIGHFPFDTQHCPMLIGAYSYYRSVRCLRIEVPVGQRLLLCSLVLQ